MKLNSDLYLAFDVLFYLLMGVSGLLTPTHLLQLFSLPPTTYKHEEITTFILSLVSLYANVLAIINLTQSLSFVIALLGDNETKRTVCKINAFLNVALVACFMYNIHYINNPSSSPISPDYSDHLLFTEQGIASIMFSNMWAIGDSAFLIYFGVYQKSGVSIIEDNNNNKIKRK